MKVLNSILILSITTLFVSGCLGPSKVAEISTRLLEEFKEINGSILCRELIQYDGSADAVDMMKAFESGAFDKCLKYVEDVSRLLTSYIE